jgi:hypothetical protein
MITIIRVGGANDYEFFLAIIEGPDDCFAIGSNSGFRAYLEN